MEWSKVWRTPATRRSNRSILAETARHAKSLPGRTAAASRPAPAGLRVGRPRAEPLGGT